MNHIYKSRIVGLLTVAFVALVASFSPAYAQDIKPFNGKNLDGWTGRTGSGEANLWLVGSAKLDPADPKKFIVDPKGKELINNSPAHGKSQDFYSKELHGDALITLEVMVPEGSNSGVYVMGEYEVQVLDSYGKDANPGAGDMGAIYGAQPPKNPKYKKPGEWSKYEIYWQAPKFNAQGEKIQNAKFLKIILNGVVIHENVEMKGPTPGGVDGKEKAKGPLMFQGNHGSVSYRNIVIKPLPAQK